MLVQRFRVYVQLADSTMDLGGSHMEQLSLPDAARIAENWVFLLERSEITPWKIEITNMEGIST